MKVSLTPAQRFLCCAISDDDGWHQQELEALWQEVGGDEAWAIAERNGAEPIVAGALRDVLEDKQIPPCWPKAVSTMSDKISLFMGELDRVATALAEDGIRLVALKNAGIARGIFPNLAGSPMGDVDVLVSHSRFREAHAIMLGLGYAMDSRSGQRDLEEAEMSGGTEYTCQLPDGSKFWFELQWRPVAGRWINEDQEPSADELLSRSISIQGSCARLLAPVDNLLQVCLHTAKHSYVRAPGFRLHTDVDRIVRRCDIDWELLVISIKRCHVRTAAYFSLSLAATLLRTPIPEVVLQQIRPAAWKKGLIESSLRRVGLFDPYQPKWSRLAYVVFSLLLYDTLPDLIRAVLPSRQWMRECYGSTSRLNLPLMYVRRIGALLLRRTRT